MRRDASVIALVFSGQGAQKPGMGKELYEQSPAARAVYDTLESTHPGLLELCFTADEQALQDTVNAQPAMVALQLALLAEVRARGLEYGAAAGFSLGEWPALTACGMIPVQELFTLILRRAALMAGAARSMPGGMAAVLGLSADDVEQVCASLTEGWASPANYNAPGQTVVSGDAAGLRALAAAVAERGGRLRSLKVSGAFHSRAMEPAAAALYDALAVTPIAPPILPWYPNRTGQRWEGSHPHVLLARQCAEPVLWEKTVRAMAADGVTAFLELGPGSVLCGLIARIVPGVLAVAAEDVAGLEKAIERLQEGLS